MALDHAGRKRPQRAVQSGAISLQTNESQVIVFSALSLVSGVSLLWVWCNGIGNESLRISRTGIIVFSRPSHNGWQNHMDTLALAIFRCYYFWIGWRFGSTYLMTKTFLWLMYFPSLSCGLFSVAVLNINNIRDIESDKAAGNFPCLFALVNKSSGLS